MLTDCPFADVKAKASKIRIAILIEKFFCKDTLQDRQLKQNELFLGDLWHFCNAVSFGQIQVKIYYTLGKNKCGILHDLF